MASIKINVKLDISENVRFIEKDSVLGVATEDGKYKRNICLLPRVKRRIPKYQGKRDKVHAVMVYNLINEELKQYGFIHLCNDASKNKLMNNLRSLFKGNKYWKELENNKKIKISAVKHSFVDSYVKKVRKDKSLRESELTYEKLIAGLKILSKE